MNREQRVAIWSMACRLEDAWIKFGNNVKRYFKSGVEEHPHRSFIWRILLQRSLAKLQTVSF